MIETKTLKKIAKARLKDAEVLLTAGRFDGAVYLLGYALELALKHRICKTLRWEGFPSTNREFNDFKSFKTHNLDVLLRLTGIEHRIKNNYLLAWTVVSEWNPEIRYNPIGSITQQESQLMLSSARSLIKVL